MKNLEIKVAFLLGKSVLRVTLLPVSFNRRLLLPVTFSLVDIVSREAGEIWGKYWTLFQEFGRTLPGN